MPKSPTIQPLSSFGAELQSTLREGANRELRIKFPTASLAARFAQRLNQLRLAMKRAAHPEWEQLYRCGIHFAEGDKTTLIIGPKDSEFRAFLSSAGVDVVPPPPISEVSVHPPSSPSDPVDEFFADLVAATAPPPPEPLPSPSDEPSPLEKTSPEG